MDSAQIRTTVAERHERATRAWRRSYELIEHARGPRRSSRQIRHKAEQACAEYLVWMTDDDSTKCFVIPHAADEHEVVMTVDGQIRWSRTFFDPVEATDERLRLRRLFAA